LGEIKVFRFSNGLEVYRNIRYNFRVTLTCCLTSRKNSFCLLHKTSQNDAVQARVYQAHVIQKQWKSKTKEEKHRKMFDKP